MAPCVRHDLYAVYCIILEYKRHGKNLQKMSSASRVGRRTNAASAVLGSRLTKAQRQLVALAFDESARRRAKSVQVKMSPRGHVTASVYLEWPARQDPPEDMEPTRGAPAQACMENVPAKTPPPVPVETDTSQKQGINDSGVPTYTVHEPAKSSPSHGKAVTKLRKVDKNALSAKGGAPPEKPQPKPKPKPPPSSTRKPSHVPSPPHARAAEHELVVGRKGAEAKRKGERFGSDSPPYKSPRGSDYDESSAESEMEDGSYGDGYGDLWDEHG
jgi:hypothetical protein